MVAKVNALGRSFAGVAAYCLHDAREEGEPRPESADRVKWAETRRLTSRIDRAAAMMAATANAAPELKRLAGVSAVGRKLAKPVLHYSLSWPPPPLPPPTPLRGPPPPPEPPPDRAEMVRAADESLRALGLDGHQALIVAHNDTVHPHVHVIANRVDPETGKAATLDRSKLRLSQWAERWEREAGRVACPERVTNNAARANGERVRDRKSLHTARHRRERMRPLTQRQLKPMRPLKAADGRWGWSSYEEQLWRQYIEAQKAYLQRTAPRCRRDWREQYDRQRAEESAAKSLAGGGVADRLRLAGIAERGDWWRLRQQTPRQEAAGKLATLRESWRESWQEARALGIRRAIGAARIDPAEAERSALAKLEQAHRVERAELGRQHTSVTDRRTGEKDPAQQYRGDCHSNTLFFEAVERRRVEAARPPPPRREPVRQPDRDPSRDRGSGPSR